MNCPEAIFFSATFGFDELSFKRGRAAKLLYDFVFIYYKVKSPHKQTHTLGPDSDQTKQQRNIYFDQKQPLYSVNFTYDFHKALFLKRCSTSWYDFLITILIFMIFGTIDTSWIKTPVY